MEKCRICLKNRKKLDSIFDIVRDISFAEMIYSISSIKILNQDDVNNKICRICRRKLEDSYEFVKIIQRSNASLQQTADVKRVYFDNINDVKFEIELFNNDINIPNELLFKNGESVVSYNDTVIKRIDASNSSDKTQTENKPINVLDFLETIKNETDCDSDSLYHDIGSNTDEEYDQPLQQIKRRKAKIETYSSNAIQTSENYEVPNFKPIKPVLLKDIRVMAANRIITKTQRKYKYGKRKEICPYCGKITSTLTAHMLVHTGERKFKCDSCDKGFYTKKMLANHLRIHSAIKNFKCDQCVASFTIKESLKSHMLSHTSERKHICDICRKAFKRKSTLSRHVMIHSFSCKTVKCELCTMSFLTKYSLKHHMRVHTGERPYRCEICSQPYSYKHDFNRHCFKKHGIFLKRRSVNIMNEEVLKQERLLMRNLMLQTHGVIDENTGINPFEGPQAAQAFEQVVKALQDKEIQYI